ncbi:hypothetical protein AALP_AA5G219200 [Arabis alpina]|uniref:Uncharacterized protein n=1 Tax=Arabis alpina TaxID=50452 RepID=A0A087GYN1_ARAAL|nr:hypothetical protein AALP_AA5G219200 [Arabis alpina]
MDHISDIKLIRTDTTLDLSQKAEKGYDECFFTYRCGTVNKYQVIANLLKKTNDRRIHCKNGETCLELIPLS